MLNTMDLPMVTIKDPIVISVTFRTRPVADGNFILTIPVTLQPQ